MPGPFSDKDKDDEYEPVDPLKGVKDLVKSVEEMPTKALDTVKKAPGKAVKKVRKLVGLKTGGAVVPTPASGAPGIKGSLGRKAPKAKTKGKAGKPKMKGASSGAMILDGFYSGTAQRSSSMAGAMSSPIATPLAPAPNTAPPTVVNPMVPSGGMGIRSASGAGGGSGGTRALAPGKLTLEEELSNSLGGANYMARAQQTMQDAMTGGGKRSTARGITGSGGGGGGTLAPVGMRSSNDLLSSGLRGMAFGGFITGKGQMKGSKGWNGKKLRRSKGVMK